MQQMQQMMKPVQTIQQVPLVAQVQKQEYYYPEPVYVQ
jgi:hypothetical protein